MMDLSTLIKQEPSRTCLIYGNPGTGKSTALCMWASHYDGKVLVLDVDRTITNAAKKAAAQGVDISNIDILQIDVSDAFTSWLSTIDVLNKKYKAGELHHKAIFVDNVSELERAMLSSLGAKGKNKGVPAQADYQYMQFNIINSLRCMRNWDIDVIWTAWEEIEDFQNPDGTRYTRTFPRISKKIIDNVCGLCDTVAKIHIDKEGNRGLILVPSQNRYAKNQYDDREVCKIEDFLRKGE